MKKVGIVSCYFKDNYGSMLQSYATQKFLDKQQIPNETINIDYNKDFKRKKKKYYLSQITNFKFIKNKFGMIKLKVDKKVNKQLGKNISIRNEKYKEFRKEFNLSRSNSTFKDLTYQAEELYSDVIVGSDQLWLPVNVVSDYYTLNWVPDNINKISYSTSFGFSNIPTKYADIYRKFLNRINHLSTREESGVKIIKELINKEAKLVSDPTILLTRNDWHEESAKCRKYNEKYILCYFLGNNIEHRKFAERLKEKTGYKIVSLNHSDEYVKYSDKFCDYAPFDIGPREWISLIENAEYVCTDSFHGTVFSILFNKIFFDFRRHNNKSKISTNSRIDSLLNVAGISNERILAGNEDIDKVLKYKIDYDKVNENMHKFRKESQNWLLNSISWNNIEIKHIDVEIREECCGCTACKNICPVNAIEMSGDKEGFLYPTINKEKCIKCGMCKNVCPVINKQNFNTYKQKAFLFQNKDITVRENSTSGGFSSAIGKYIIEQNGVVFGATYDENFIVIHDKAVNEKELEKFRKSKYSQSDLKSIFLNVKNYLEEGRLVCFSGTPCQVAGLKKYLNKDYDNLILVDIMCHSVPSPLVFEKYKKYILKKMKANKIKNINFRDKRKYGYKYPMMTVNTDNGEYSQGIDTDPFLRAFFEDYSVRPSCYKCKFKTQKRVSDITIWDCFNINEIDKTFDDDKGTTRILVQSSKGEEVLRKLKNTKLKEINVDKAIKNVKEMNKSVLYNQKRKDFFKDINNEDVMDIYFPINLKTKINSFIRKILSMTGMYSTVKTVSKKILKK